jgi:protein gp37
LAAHLAGACLDRDVGRNPSAAEKRIPYLLDLPASIMFLSCEPLVEEVVLAPWLAHGTLKWVICGGYSGSQQRPMELAWARSLRDECQQCGVAFFMKQLGSVYARDQHLRNWKGEAWEEFPEHLKVRAFPVEPGGEQAQFF